MKGCRSLLLVLFITTTLTAQLPPIGQPFALTNTRYGTTSGTPVLRTNGRDAFLFWADGRLRVTRVGQNNDTPGLPVFDFGIGDRSNFDAVWTGTHFLVVASSVVNVHRLFGRLVDASGTPAGDAFPIESWPQQGLWPRLAFNGRYVLLIDDNVAIALTPDGRSAGSGPQEFVRTYAMGPALVASNGDRFAVITWSPDPMLSMFDANGQFLSSRGRLTDSYGRLALASDGRRFLVVEAKVGLSAMFIQPDGAFDGWTPLESGQDRFYEPAVTWDGSRWVIAYWMPESTQTTVAEADADARSITWRRMIRSAVQPAIVSVGPRVVTAWVDYIGGSISASELPIVDGAPASFSAKPQYLLATASSPSATLVLWREAGNLRPSIRAGIRTHDGRWREREIAPDIATVSAASDGRDFMVLRGSTLIPLDAELRAAPEKRITEFKPGAIAWNGRDYAVIGEKDGLVAIALVSPDGSISPAVMLPYPASTVVLPPRIASNNGEWFAVWPVQHQCSVIPEEVCYPGEVAGIHLDADLHVTDPSPQTFVIGQRIYSFDVAWSGTRYVVAWSSPSGVFAARAGTQGTTLISAIHESYALVSVADTAGRAAIGWTAVEASSLKSQSRVALLDDVTPAILYQGDEFPALRVTSLPGGDLAILYAASQDGVPLYGTRRVMIAIAAFGLPPLPDAPGASLKQDGTTVMLAWSPPPQRVNGYRVESRVNNGAWIEVERWFDPEERTYTTTIPAGASFAFRARALNDAGAGAYSQAVVATGANKPRAARH
jgi:hypothetical protein